MKKSPCDGGCWFCSTDDNKEDMVFSWEFDTNLHKKCLDKALAEGKNDEARIIADELGISIQK